ncbi:hypothetical protein DVS28_a1663 [Euzebya pacifica]|uniref:Uncharacterized protein n=1 Tax=Euzebya pacifica TaxID=1608957 RepID=A0A346XVV7_9ACTN|nr:hypothetical protein DVS28_a1663 [Euzebya pacifica]
MVTADPGWIRLRNPRHPRQVESIPSARPVLITSRPVV